MRRLDDRFAAERRLIEFGVTLTLHSDAGVRLTPIDRFDLGLMAAVRELRLTPAEALRAATGTAAEALGLDDRGVLRRAGVPTCSWSKATRWKTSPASAVSAPS